MALAVKSSFNVTLKVKGIEWKSLSYCLINLLFLKDIFFIFWPSSYLKSFASILIDIKSSSGDDTYNPLELNFNILWLISNSLLFVKFNEASSSILPSILKLYILSNKLISILFSDNLTFNGLVT